MARRRRRCWAPLLVAAAVGVLAAVIGVGPAHAASPPVLVSASPCDPAPGSSACTADPTTLSASWPVGSAVGGVTVAWDGTGRPTAAPAPAVTTVGLSTSSGSCAAVTHGGSTSCTWGWPAGLRDASGGQLLNGTYRVTVCSNDPGTSAGPSPPACAAAPALVPAAIGIGVAPAAPTGLTSSSGSTVVLRWDAAMEADLAGYRVARDGATVWACSANGAGGASAPCPAAPVVTDPAPPGTHTYAVTALRFGPAGSAPLVPSAPSRLTGTVAGAVTGASTGGSQVSLPPVPYVGPAVTLPAAHPPAAPAAQRATTAAPDTGFGLTLPYAPADPAVTPPLASRATPATEAGTPSPSTVERAALFAVGMLILAVAAHLLFLKGEITRRDELFRAFRHAAGIGAGLSTGGRPPSPGRREAQPRKG